MKTLIFVTSLFVVFQILALETVQAGTLETPSFIVTVESHCAEGEVTCDKVSYQGVSKKTGNAIALQGRTVHSLCGDGAPCRFLGYIFESGSYRYRVGEEGLLVVTRGDEVLVSERGEWRW